MNVYKVKVKTTNASMDTTYGPTHVDTYGTYNADYVTVEKGFLYVMADSPSCVEEFVRSDMIISIERVGIGLAIS